MQRLTRRTILAAAPTALAFGGAILAPLPARAAKKYGPGVTDTEIKIAGLPVFGNYKLRRGRPPAGFAALNPPYELRLHCVLL